MQKLFVKQVGDTLFNDEAFKRWLYRAQRSGWIAKMLNRMWAIVALSGVTSILKAYLQVAEGAQPHIQV